MPYPPLQCSAVMSWYAASIASWRDIWSCGRWTKTFHIQTHKTPQWGWGKGSKGEEKETSFSNGCQTRHWEWRNATLFHVITYVTMDHKTSLKCQFLEIDIYTLSESLVNKFPLMYGLLGSDNIWPRYNYLKIWNLRVQKKSKYWENRL